MKYVIFTLLFFLIGGNLLADENYVTVYNDNLGLIKQVRTVSMDKKNLPIRFSDVAAQLIPTSVHLRNLSGNKNFQVLEQNFEYDLVSSDKILEKYIDHPVEIIRENGELIQGTLLSKQGGSMVVKTDDGIKIVPWNDNLAVNVKELPEGLITRPTLIWEVSGVKSGNEKLEVSYLTQGMNWHAEYVGELNEKSTQLNLDAWVSIDNKCGATYKDAHLKLVAGEVHRAPQPRRTFEKGEQITAYAMDESRGFQEKAFFEYHIYDLDRPTTIKDNQTKQISLFPSATVNVDKKYYYNANTDPTKVAVRLLFVNDEKAGLGKPLPEGVFRIYQRDGESLEFIGEDRIDHTPRNEEIKITVGNAFDLVGERRIIDRKKISNRSERQTIEIELRNNKEKEDVNIVVEEQIYYRDWKIEDNNFPYKKKDVNNITFDVPVKANGKAVLQYTITYSW
jgi:hypothetical protein